jgi:transposase
MPLQEVAAQMKVLYERVAGIDVHKDMIKVAIRSPGEKRWTRKTEIFEFRTFYGVLQEMARELRRRGVTHVVMEASGVYTEPVYHALCEQDFEQVAVINPAHAKALKGHKTDAKDCARLAELFECGLLHGSYMPSAEQKEARDLTRYRMKTVQARTSEIQRLAKALESAGIKLGSVVSEITGVSATAMIDALIDGERRGAMLADLARGRMRTAGKLADLSMALTGRFTEHHALLCRLHRDRIAGFDVAVADLDERIAGKAARWHCEADLLTTVPGFGDVVTWAWLAEIGPAPHLWFASHEKLASWVTLCPGNNISAKKRKHGRTGDAGTYIKPMLVQAAWAAIRTRGRLQARYNRLVRRFGGDKNPGAKKKAITAIAHTLLKIAYQVLKSGMPYAEPGADFYTRRESPEQRRKYHERQIQKIYPGRTVTVIIGPPPQSPPHDNDAPGGPRPATRDPARALARPPDRHTPDR